MRVKQSGRFLYLTGKHKIYLRVIDINPVIFMLNKTHPTFLVFQKTAKTPLSLKYHNNFTTYASQFSIIENIKYGSITQFEKRNKIGKNSLKYLITLWDFPPPLQKNCSGYFTEVFLWNICHVTHVVLSHSDFSYLITLISILLYAKYLSNCNNKAFVWLLIEI